jgi:hypothetical protein
MQHPWGCVLLGLALATKEVKQQLQQQLMGQLGES